MFTLTNTGNVPLTGIGQGVLTGANTADFAIAALGTNCGIGARTTLAVGATCTVAVQFKPLTAEPAGNKKATLSVTDAAGTQSSQLSGTAN